MLIMRVIAVIAEYNPFHKGHEYLIKRARESVGDPRAVVLSIMSGPFTQRGLPACCPKHIRAKQALRCGSDVVLELPFEFACAPANEFAYGAVRSLMMTGVVTDIAFGTDGGTPSLIDTLASPSLYGSPEYERVLKQSLSDGLSFPASNAAAVEACISDPSVSECLRSPNSILAIEYLKAMRTLGAGLKVHMISRAGSSYSSSDLPSDMPSATAIRKALASCGNSVSSAAGVLSASVPDRAAAVMLSALSSGSFEIASLDKYALRAVTTPIDDLTSIRFCGDGLGGYLANELSELRASDVSFESLTRKLSTKHFTMSRIYRALTMAMLGIRSGSADSDPKYLRVLGFNHEGRYCLKIMGKCASLPVIYNQSDMLGHPSLARSLEITTAAENLAASFMNVAPNSCWNDPPAAVK